jgi:hypothetical protein
VSLTLAALSENYRRFVEGEIARLGLDHPSIQTQYLLHAIDDAGTLVYRAMLGDHPGETAGADGALAIGLVTSRGKAAATPWWPPSAAPATLPSTSRCWRWWPGTGPRVAGIG